MTKKEIEKLMPKIRKEVCRAHGFRQSSYINFKIIDGYFFCIVAWESLGPVSIGFSLQVKPMYADTLLWEMSGDLGCQDMPLSYRGNGTYTVDCLNLGEFRRPGWKSLPEVEEIRAQFEEAFRWADEEIAKFLKENPDPEAFIPVETLKNNSAHVQYLMALIHNGLGDEALEFIRKKREEGRNCGNQWIDDNCKVVEDTYSLISTFLGHRSEPLATF